MNPFGKAASEEEVFNDAVGIFDTLSEEREAAFREEDDIFRSALDLEPRKESDGDRTPEMTRDFFGRPISDEDWIEHGNDPMQRIRTKDERSKREAELEAERDELRAQLEEHQTLIGNELERPMRQERHDQLVEQIMRDPGAVAAQITQAREANRVEVSFRAANSKHGAHFNTIYKALTSLNPSNPQHRATVQRIWNSPDPGGALMRWGANIPRPSSARTKSLSDAHGGGSMHRYGAPRAGDSGSDADILAAAFDD